MTDVQNLPSGSVDILTLSAQQLSSLQSRLSQELEHLTTSYTRLRSAQARFRDCINSIKTGVSSQPQGTLCKTPYGPRRNP
jgi:prefoldin alpha subunit